MERRARLRASRTPRDLSRDRSHGATAHGDGDRFFHVAPDDSTDPPSRGSYLAGKLPRATLLRVEGAEGTVHFKR